MTPWQQRNVVVSFWMLSETMLLLAAGVEDITLSMGLLRDLLPSGLMRVKPPPFQNCSCPSYSKASQVTTPLWKRAWVYTFGRTRRIQQSG